MKNKSKLLVIGVLLMSFNSFPKGENGIYMNVDDYMNHKLSYETNSKIKLNNSLVNESYITVIDGGKKLKLKKTDLYGYMDGNKEAHRFYKGDDYEVAEAGNIFIYTQTQKVAQSKGYKVAISYYFSKSAAGNILSLTIDNLKNEYRDNEKFVSALEYLSMNNNISSFDKEHNTFSVNYLMSQNINK